MLLKGKYDSETFLMINKQIYRQLRERHMLDMASDHAKYSIFLLKFLLNLQCLEFCSLFAFLFWICLVLYINLPC